MDGWTRSLPSTRCLLPRLCRRGGGGAGGQGGRARVNGTQQHSKSKQRRKGLGRSVVGACALSFILRPSGLASGGPSSLQAPSQRRQEAQRVLRAGGGGGGWADPAWVTQGGKGQRRAIGGGGTPTVFLLPFPPASHPPKPHNTRPLSSPPSPLPPVGLTPLFLSPPIHPHRKQPFFVSAAMVSGNGVSGWMQAVAVCCMHCCAEETSRRRRRLDDLMAQGHGRRRHH